MKIGNWEVPEWLTCLATAVVGTFLLFWLLVSICLKCNTKYEE